MSSNTPNLGLLKKDPTTERNDTFNIKTMMNDNWDKIDEAVGALAVGNTGQVPHLGTTTNIGNSYSVTTTATVAVDQKFTVKFNAASTAAPTLSINAGGAFPVKNSKNTSAKIDAGVGLVFWDGANFTLLGEGVDTTSLITYVNGILGS